MLPKKNRIPRKDFPADRRQGFRVFSPLFSGVVYPSSYGVRVSVVVSKKTAKTAVVRNTMRRRMYAAITPFLKRFPRDVFVVLYPKAEVKQAPFSVLQKEIETALRKLVK
ncbi:MAG: ribonuclease P protein component [Minisyncoccota bacterium]